MVSRIHAQHNSGDLVKNTQWEYDRKHFATLCAAEFHWFFVQGVDAIWNEYYVPGVSSLLNGVEASLRVTITQVSRNERGNALDEPSPYRVLSNNLIVDALDLGMPVQALAFSGETDFLEKLKTEKPNRIDVEVVRQRNNICHGNIFEFINRELGPESSFFTPECLRPLAFSLLEVCRGWATEIGEYRGSKGLAEQ